ncbi:MAG: hypothetical protein HY698_17935 [Deltaproteobacteria bacterium]|nr:hypothetical protein [Deltaproteobacteria bacterium]
MSRQIPFLLAPLALLCACATVVPRFPQAVATSFARDEMRKLETPSLEVYYPPKHRGAALRVAARLEYCMRWLKFMPKKRVARDKAVVFITSSDFNNAYVQGDFAGVPQQMVLPHHMTLEMFNWLGLGGSEIGDVSCHEAVHYVQFQDAHGFWAAVNKLAGGLFSPTMFLDTWFLEGMATYYEGKLGPSVGRPHSPLWRGVFEAGVAQNGGRITAADLSPISRRVPLFGGHYLVGMNFVDFLARRYGEDKLWDVTHAQGSSIFAPFGVTLRFRAVYGKDIGGLLDEFSDELSRRHVKRVRPKEQRIVASSVGHDARIAVSKWDGATAIVSESRDDEVRLTVKERDGSVRFSTALTQVLPGRRWVSISPILTSGLEFTADGKYLFLVAADVDRETSFTARLWQVDARSGEVLRTWDGLGGAGGSIRPDGAAYVYVDVHGDSANLVRLDLGSGGREQLTSLEGTVSLGAPAYSPDGQRIVFSRWNGTGFDLALWDSSTPSALPLALTSDGRFNYQARWIDDAHIVFLREHEGRAQVHVMEVATRAIARLSNAPYVALDPAPTPRGEVLFLSREGWGWSLDAVPLRTAASAQGLPGLASPAAAAATQPAVLDATTATSASRPTYPQLEIQKDESYSQLDHLFRPTLRFPFFWATSEGQDSPTHYVVGLSLRGGDRLGFHDYALNVTYDTGNDLPDVGVGYGNHLLAPWFLSAQGTRVERRLGGEVTTDLKGTLSATRLFWTSPLELHLLGLKREVTEGTMDPSASQLAGFGVSLKYSAEDSTAYGGIKRGMGLFASADVYPQFMGSDFEMGDLSTQVSFYLPLPLLKRHSFGVLSRGRSLPGAPSGLLRLGGGGGASALRGWGEKAGPAGPDLFLPDISFQEPLRGYEDHGLPTTHAVVLGAHYRYPLIIDYGWSSFLYLLPPFLVRELEMELFAEGAHASLPSSGLHRAAGLAVHLRTSLGFLPLTLSYQVAKRFDDGLPVLQLILLTAQ